MTLVLVSPQDRRSGVGRALVSRVLDICRERGFASCALEVRSDNAPAIALYSSLGFVSAGERDGRQRLECAL
jgi:ribosomal protein S18 acetylase RimI-like enzyme